jgi:hypothetical protein
MTKRGAKKRAFAPMFLLVMGGLLMPGGFLLSNVIQNVVANEIDTALIGIEAQGVPLVEGMVKQMGVGEVMYRIHSMAGPIVEEMVNCTFTAYLLQTMLDGIDMDYEYASLGITLAVTADPATPADIFNDAEYYLNTNAKYLGGFIWVDVFDVDGLAMYCGAGVTYSTTALNRIFYGNDTSNPDSRYYIPGLVQDVDSGSGVSDFLDLYDAAGTNTTLQNQLMSKYSCTSWTQIQHIAVYLREYLEKEIIPTVIAGVTVDVTIADWLPVMTVYIDLLGTLKPNLTGMTSTDEIADAIFKEIWANGTAMGEVVYPGGLDFGDMLEGLPENTVGFEVGMPPNPSGITRAVVTELWNKSTPLSIFNMDAMETWYKAWTDASKKQLLLDTFPGLTPTQLDRLLIWMWDGPHSFSQFMVPILLESAEGYGIPLPIFAKNLLLEQWANGTIMGEVMYPYGFPLPLGDMIIYGLEVGYRSQTETVLSTGMSLEAANALWNKSISSSLETNEGIAKWWKAVEDPTSTEAQVLQSDFGLSDKAMTMLYAWLGNFKTNAMPFLAQYQLGLPFDTTTLCQMLTVGGFGIGAMLLVTGSVVSVKRSRAAKGRDPSALSRSMKAAKMSQYQAPGSTVPTTSAQHLQINVTAPERPAEIPKSSVSSPAPQAAPVVIYTPSVSFVQTPLPQPPQVQPVAPAPAAYVAPAAPAVASYIPSAVTSRSMPVVAPLPAPIKEQPAAAPRVSATTEISMPETTNPEEKEFFQKILNGMKMINTKINRKESVDPLFISNLLYLLRTRRKRYEIQGNTATVQKMDAMYRGIEELRNDARSLLKKS